MSAPRLLLITDPETDVVAVVRAAMEGADARVAVQLRDKRSGARELAAQGRALLPLVRAAGARLVINDRADVARAIGADGVHLPERGLSVRDARAALGEGALVGCSRHDAAGLTRAAGADYVTLGPVAAVPGKGAPMGVEGLPIAGDAPVLALGGVDVAMVPALRARGVHGVAVCRAVMRSPAPARVVRAFLEALEDP